MTAIKYKQELSTEIADTLESASGGDALSAVAFRIKNCVENENLYLAGDLFNKETGECFDGRGSLWGCNCRLCAFCVGKVAKEHRKKMRFVMANTKLLIGENWYFNTFTLPDLAFVLYSLPTIAKVFQTAWENFTHCETNENKTQTWYQKHFRGGFKNCEFTIGRLKQFHYHLHALMIGKSKIQRDNFIEIRRQWTKSLQFAFKQHGIKWQCNTVDGFAVVNVQKVDRASREGTINELCKYVTKGDSWSKVPTNQLIEVASMARFFRMFESFGVCRRIARRMPKLSAKEQNQRGEQQKEAKNAVNLLLEFLLFLNNGAYFNTTFLIPRIFDRLSSNYSHAPPKKKKRSWFHRIKDKEISLADYKNELLADISKAIHFRKIQLRRMYPAATFRTLAGETF